MTWSRIDRVPSRFGQQWFPFLRAVQGVPGRPGRFADGQRTVLAKPEPQGFFGPFRPDWPQLTLGGLRERLQERVLHHPDTPGCGIAMDASRPAADGTVVRISQFAHTPPSGLTR